MPPRARSAGIFSSSTSDLRMRSDSPPDVAPRAPTGQTGSAFPEAPERVPAGCPPAALRCNRCGLEYDEDAWADLAPERFIEASELGRLFMNWPAGTRIEVRRCHRCGALVS